MSQKVTTIGVLTSGGDAPGMNLDDPISSKDSYLTRYKSDGYP